MAAPIEYADAAPEVRAVYDDIKQTRQIKDVNNFWKYLAHDPDERPPIDLGSIHIISAHLVNTRSSTLR
jgi:hypothetical protein